MKERVKCCKQISDPPHYLRRHQCSRWSVVTRDGKPYCWQHDPERTKASHATPWPSGVTLESRTLSRDTAIKLIEAAEESGIHSETSLYAAVGAAKRELGI